MIIFCTYQGLLYGFITVPFLFCLFGFPVHLSRNGGISMMVCVGNMPDIMFSPPLKSPGRSWCDEEEEEEVS